MSDFIPMYDLESLNEQQRQDYIKAVCKHIGVPPELNLVMLTYLDENEGPRRLVAYAKRGATEIIRNSRGIEITALQHAQIGGSIVWTATAKDSKGRQEMSSGSKWIQDLTGKDLDDAIMTAQTRACRRVTLQFVGAGILDESEVNPNITVNAKETKFSAAIAPQPTVEPSNAPGVDVTAETPEQFSARMEQLRKDAIAHLNAKFSAQPVTAKQEQNTVDTGESCDSAPAEPVKRTRKPRAPKVDLGPSEPVPASPAPQLAPPVAQIVVTPVPALPAAPVAIAVAPPAAAPGKSRLSPDQMKPFRQRQFKLVNELEENGFAPKEGMGNQDKLRAFAGLLFPEVTNFNEMTVEQWEKYLTTIETKIKTVGPTQTIQYLEESIGI